VIGAVAFGSLAKGGVGFADSTSELSAHSHWRWRTNPRIAVDPNAPPLVTPELNMGIDSLDCHWRYAVTHSQFASTPCLAPPVAKRKDYDRSSTR
jgi:hypothetical protein